MMRFAVIMAGGRGERLWPLSRKKMPKQFLKLLGEQTMLQETVERIAPLIPHEKIYVVVGEEHVGIVHEQLPMLPARNIVVEPWGRGTAPCVGLAALRLSRIDPEGVMIVLPADHVVQDKNCFLKLLEDAMTIAAAGSHLVTLGITPDRPATGYGYIQAFNPFAASDLSTGSEVLKVERFTEKPDKETAEQFLDEGGYFWNSGMFIWRVDAILHEMKAHMPKLHAGLMAIENRIEAPDYEEALERIYRRQDVTSIDCGVMEKSNCVLVLPTGEIGWSDIGDWSALNEVLKTDEEGNIILASHIGIDTSNSIILSKHTSDRDRLVATLGVSDLVIIDTDDILLVMDKARAQEVKRIIQIQTAEKDKEAY